MNKKGQNFLEYALLVGCIALALSAMNVYFKRGIQGVIKSTQDDLASPAVQVFSELNNGQVVNGQILGMAEEMVEGVTSSQPEPATTEKDLEIVYTERARGEKGFVINRDRVTAEASKWITQVVKTPVPDYGTLSVKVNTDVPASPGIAADGLLSAGEMRAVTKSGGTITSQSNVLNGGIQVRYGGTEASRSAPITNINDVRNINANLNTQGYSAGPSGSGVFIVSAAKISEIVQSSYADPEQRQAAAGTSAADFGLGRGSSSAMGAAVNGINKFVYETFPASGDANKDQ